MNNTQVTDLFVEQGVLDRSQVEDVLLEATENGKPIAEAIVNQGIVDEHGFYQTIADALGTELIDLTSLEIPPEILRLIPTGLARLHGALPVGVADNAIKVALADPLDTQAVEDLRFALGRDIQVVVAPTSQIEERLRRHYGEDTSTMEDILKQLG